MYIDRVPNRNSPPCILLRESYREGKRVRKRTLLNLTDWDPELVASFEALLKGGSVVPSRDQLFEILRALPHGHAAAVLGMVRALGLERLVAAKDSRQRRLVVAMIVQRVLDPRSKLGMARALDAETATSSLGELLDLGSVDEDDLYAAMDWLLPRQRKIEESLAKRHLEGGSLVLYDLTSTYFEGRSCPLARMGYSRDGKRGSLQIEFGLLCNVDGCPVAVQVFEGNVADPMTLKSQIDKLKEEFKLARVVLVSDRGMLTEARLREDVGPEDGLDFITCLRAPAIAALVEQGDLQLSLFDERDLMEIRSSEYPGERLIVCRNPYLAEDRRRTREDLLRDTEAELTKIAQAATRAKNPLRGEAEIALRVGRVIDRKKMAKHFILDIREDGFSFVRDESKIADEAALDGFYVIRTNVPEEELSAEGAVRAYKRLSRVERAFRTFKGVDLRVRPIHHHLADRVRAHVFLCMLSYYVEWHLRREWAPLLFDDEEPEAGEARRASVVAPAQRSESAEAKARTKRTAHGLPVHDFHGLLAHLSTLTHNRCLQPSVAPGVELTVLSAPTPVQQCAFDLLGLRPEV